MKRKTAYKVAIEALERRKRNFIWDANLYRKGGVKYIGGARAVKKVERIEKAIEILQNDLEKI